MKKDYSISSCFSTCVFLCLILFSCGQITNAQSYPSIFGAEKTQFNIVDFCAAIKGSSITGQTVIFSIGNDTIIEENVYKKISYEQNWFYDYSFYVGIREDTIEGKIFVYGDPFGEILTCDFSLSVGDTFFFPQYVHNFLIPSGFNYNNAFMIADSIYSIDGRRTITFDGPFYVDGSNVYRYYFDFGYFQKVSFIEGIGPNYGPFDWISMIQMLLCSHKDDNLVYMQREDLGCEYNDCGHSVNEATLDRIKIYPNPATTEFYLQSDEVSLDEVFIYTIQGQFVKQMKLQGESQKIDITTIQSGLYLLKVKDSQGNIYSTKIVKM